jgi:hypothetical protein
MFTVNRLKAGTEFAPETPREPTPEPMEAMDVDGYDDLGEGTSMGVRRSVVSPGEVITSAKEYMRYVIVYMR